MTRNNLAKVFDLLDEGCLEDVGAFIYRLYLDGEIVYVGQTINLKQRIFQHLSVGEIKFDDFSYFECTSDNKNNHEAIEIVEHSPKHNRMLPPNGIYQGERQIVKKISESFYGVILKRLGAYTCIRRADQSDYDYCKINDKQIEFLSELLSESMLSDEFIKLNQEQK